MVEEATGRDIMGRYLVEKYRPEVRFTTFYGIPIEEMSREELLGVIGKMSDDIKNKKWYLYGGTQNGK